jgi:hypothetical protein
MTWIWSPMAEYRFPYYKRVGNVDEPREFVVEAASFDEAFEKFHEECIANDQQQRDPRGTGG